MNQIYYVFCILKDNCITLKVNTVFIAQRKAGLRPLSGIKFALKKFRLRDKAVTREGFVHGYDNRKVNNKQLADRVIAKWDQFFSKHGL